MELAEQKQRVNIGEQYRAVGKFGEQGEVKKSHCLSNSIE